MGTPLILALDLGTSSTRAAFFDVAGTRLVATTVQQNYPLVTSADGGAELEPGVLLGAARKCIEGVMQKYRTDSTVRGRPVLAVGVSSFWHSLVGVDGRGSPITRVITWADSRCRKDAAELREKMGEKKAHSLTGCMLRASFWPAKLKWLKRTDPKLFGRVKQWMSPAEWLQMTLLGDASCSISMASGTGLFNPTKLKWDPSLLETCGITPENLRTVSDEPTPTHGELAEQFAELRGVPWYPAMGDGAASNLGCGATKEGFAAINVGTSAAIRVLHERKEATAPLGLFAYRVDAQRYVAGGAVSNAGNLRAWCLREFKLPDEATIEKYMTEHPGPSATLMVLPFWTAERAPTWNEEATGMIHGLTQHTTSLELLHAITEATYQRLARIADLLIGETEKAPKLVVSGGIQRSAQAIQRLADALNHPVYPNEEMEASIRGAAIFAIEKLGMPTPITKLGTAIKPRTKFARQYAEARVRQQRYEEFSW